jgi:hypothetical protein
MITIKPMGGLANRIRAVDSAMHLADAQQRPLRLVWESSFELNCRFDRLFTPPAGVQVLETHRGPLAKRAFERAQRTLRRLGVAVPWGYDHHVLGGEAEQAAPVAAIARSRRCYIATPNRFAPANGFFQRVRPLPAIEARIQALATQLGPHSLGVHIRRSDNANAIRHSPSAGFHAVIDQAIAAQPALTIYLATDSADEQRTIEARYPGRVLCPPKTLDRNSEAGIIDALVDLYTLAATQRIVGSHFSSFSEVAAEVRGTPLEQVYRPAGV